MSCDREGNRMSGVALAMRHRLKRFTNLRAQGLSKGDEHPTNTLYLCLCLAQRESSDTGEYPSGYKGIYTAKLPCIAPQRDRTTIATS